MNVIRFPNIKKVRGGFAYGGKTYVNMDYLIKSMTPKEKAQFNWSDDEQLLKQG
jgi:hypothetical protein